VGVVPHAIFNPLLRVLVVVLESFSPVEISVRVLSRLYVDITSQVVVVEPLFQTGILVTTK
jgi:hypothetical protein